MLIRAVLTALVARNFGRVVNISSATVCVPRPPNSPYAGYVSGGLHLDGGSGSTVSCPALIQGRP